MSQTRPLTRGERLPAPDVVDIRHVTPRAPAIRVRYCSDEGKRRTHWIVVCCPFCEKPHRHAATLQLGDPIKPPCTKARYRIAPVESVR